MNPVALTAGDKLGPYEIVAPIGAGGMGEVYKARDTRLDRTVAIKVLPAHIAQREELRARFEREARAVASLNHPNICTLYDIGNQEGVGGYMVMEYLEGETLEARIGRGALPLETAVAYAQQTADALDRAHRAGVTHRDIKPGNIMLTRDGVKVLDFGLAKSTAKPGPTDATIVKSLTTEGTVLGTPQYMAPEQFEGKEADARSDIWAFGAVLYEMVTGRKAFEGKSYSSLVGAILSMDPVPMAVKPVTPAWLERLVRRCLAKDPEDRWQSMRDVVLELRAPMVESTPALAPVGRPVLWMALVGAAAVLAVAFAFLWLRAGVRRNPPPPLRFNVDGSRTTSPISPDGAAMVSMSLDGLSLRYFSELLPRTLPGTQGAFWPFWSGDSSAIGFFRQGKLCIMPVATSEVREVATAPEPGGAAWRGSLRSGEIVFVSSAKLHHLNLATGASRELLIRLPPGHVILNPTLLPAGSDFVFTAGPPAERKTLYRGSVKGGSPVELMRLGLRVQFARHPQSGQWHMFYTPEESPRLMAVAVDPVTGQKIGEPVQLVDGVGAYFPQRRPTFEVSENGRLVFRRNFMAAPVFRIRWHAMDGTVLATLADRIASNEILLSPDEKQVAAITGYPRKGVTLYDARSGNSRRLTGPWDNVGQGLAWTPDSRMLYYQAEQADGSWQTVRHPIEGVSRPEPVGRSEAPLTLMEISRDGRYLLFGPSQIAGTSLLVLSTSGTGTSRPETWLATRSEPFPGPKARFTPDGNWLLVPLGGAMARFVPWRPEPQAEPATGGAFNFYLAGPFFSHDGRKLCGVPRLKDAIVCHSVQLAPGRMPELGPPVVQFASVTAQMSGYGKIGTIARDGRMLLLSTDEPEELETQFLSDWTMLLPKGQPDGSPGSKW
ncbi:MAG: protein kinase [Acidobacteria bacterium]|nr:protein kinase [Acidobacteriota bacterium]